MNYDFTVKDRFLKYTQIDTQSDPHSLSIPSTIKQKNLAKVLVSELLTMGIRDAHLDEFGYVYATIPSNTAKKPPVICFCSHIDTSPDCSGADVKPIVHQNYQGQDLVLPDDPKVILKMKEHPDLAHQIENDIITASGKTLLGADNKAGVAEIVDAANYLMTHPEVKHGEIKILFTPDEEVGKGTDNVDLKKLGATVAYTLDGGELGTLEDETFSADGVKIIVHGVSAHPGYAKGILVNALKIAGEILTALPKTEWSPETTTKREGFVHPLSINGIAEKATIDFIVRDFTVEGLLAHETKLKSIAEDILKQYPNCTMEFVVKEQYRNMKQILDLHPEIVANAVEAYQRCGLTVVKEPIRGGTDGSRLSYMGLPCPNLFTGMQAIHSKHEWIGVYDMEQSAAMLIQLVQVWEEKVG